MTAASDGIKSIWLKGHWSGASYDDDIFEYGFNPGEFFMNLRIDTDGNFQGKGYDKCGQSEITGSLREGKIEFEKRYAGQDAKKITYKGTMDNGYYFRGSWRPESGFGLLDKYGDPLFEMNIVDWYSDKL